MGYRSVLRSVGSAIRQAEREAIRRQKALERQRAAYEKMQALEQAAYDVEIYENYLERVTTLHKDCTSSFDWVEIVKKKPPVAPVRSDKREMIAKEALEIYRPGILDRLFNRTEKKRKVLEDAIAQAVQADEAEYVDLRGAHETEMKEFVDLIGLATAINNGDQSAYRRAIQELEPLSEISSIGSQIDFEFFGRDKMSVSMSAHDGSIIPKESKSLLKSGKLSIKEMPIGKYNELYQDYVCSASIRVAREIFGLLPINEIIVNTRTRMLNRTTGKQEEQIILSVRFVRDTMVGIDFDNIDPSDSMANFVHNMGFKKTQGMSRVAELSFA